jgi:hypothetical protein
VDTFEDNLQSYFDKEILFLVGFLKIGMAVLVTTAFIRLDRRKTFFQEGRQYQYQ